MILSMLCTDNTTQEHCRVCASQRDHTFGSCKSHDLYDDTYWKRQEVSRPSIEILYADLWLLATIHHSSTAQKIPTYTLCTYHTRLLWALHTGEDHVVVESDDCGLSKVSQLRRYQNLITHESQHPCAQETLTSSMISAIPTQVVGEVDCSRRHAGSKQPKLSTSV